MRKKPIAASVFCTCAIVGAFVLTIPTAEGTTAAPTTAGTQPSVTVDGSGQSVGTPDALQFDFNVDVTRSDVGSALSAANATAATVTGVLTGQGVAAADVQTSGLNVSPKTGKHGAIVGFEVTESLSALLRNFTGAGPVVSAVIAAGGRSISVQDITPVLTDPSAPGKAARSLAFADAQRRAQQYADLAGRSLGSVLAINASSNTPQDSVGTAKAPASGTVLGENGSPTPTSGSVPVDITITVTWALR